MTVPDSTAAHVVQPPFTTFCDGKWKPRRQRRESRPITVPLLSYSVLILERTHKKGIGEIIRQAFLTLFNDFANLLLLKYTYAFKCWLAEFENWSVSKNNVQLWRTNVYPYPVQKGQHCEIGLKLFSTLPYYKYVHK